MDKNFKVRDMRKKGWFFLDNEYLNGMGKYVGPIGIAVYVSLCRHSDNEQKCFPSQETIAREIGSSERSVREYLKKLESLNIIVSMKERKSDGSWLNNVYYLLDKTEWTQPEAGGSDGQPEANDDTARGRRFRSQRQEVPTNNTNINNTNKKNTNNTAIQGIAEKKLIDNFINLFKDINPSYKKFFANKTQRKAMNNLLDIHGEEKLVKIIGLLSKTNEMNYAPVITSPFELEKKMASLISFVKRNNTEKNNITKIQ